MRYSDDPFLAEVQRESDEAMKVLKGTQNIRERIANLKIKKVEFPLSTLPPRMEAFVRAYMTTFSVPADHYGLAILTSAGAAIGNTARIDDRGTLHPAILDSCFVEIPGSGKTPTINTVLKPFTKIEWENQRRYSEQLAAAKQLGEDAEEVEPPHELLVGDFTLESLIDVLENNPRGVLAWADEIEGFLQSMDKYRTGKGGDEKFWLSAYTGEPYKINRRNRGRSVFLPRVFCPFMGGIQPGLLNSFADGNRDASGFLSRVLFTIPPTAKKQYYHKNRPSEDHAYHWDQVVRRLLGLSPAETIRESDGKEMIRPHIVKMSKEAESTYADFVNGLADQINALDDTDITSRATLVKFETHCLRFALILHFLDWASLGLEAFGTPTTDNEFADALADGYVDTHDIALQPISRSVMIRATELSEYFMATGLEVVGRLSSPVNSLKPDQRAWFENLPEEGSRDIALALGKAADLSASTVDRLLRKKELFIYRKAAFEKVV